MSLGVRRLYIFRHKQESDQLHTGKQRAPYSAYTQRTIIMADMEVDIPDRSKVSDSGKDSSKKRFEVKKVSHDIHSVLSNRAL